MSRPDDELDDIVERAETLEEWVGVRQADNEDRDAQIRREIAEQIATAIEERLTVEIGDGLGTMHTVGWNAAKTMAARIAREAAA